MTYFGSGGGRRQIEEFMRAVDPDVVTPGRFEPVDDKSGRKWRCTLCGRTGYKSAPRALDLTGVRTERHRNWYRWLAGGWSVWMIACCFPHEWPCSCGKRFRSYASLWRHIGGPRPAGWGRPGEHVAVLSMEVTP